ncbi:hypothetical protein QW060_08865 [Myroides ceti]|uniref:Uncharacterized protein n=1 Tax=Paenimyroides ceti TaxID=395087 RepID=A0ABT8CVN9_9FLAO|nr:hypothetical protein [Paenimyroides ceti]MDN3707245.1 hypothetical protein [Paenimyroides ceti]
MVPLEERIDYLSRVNKSQKLTAFNNLLLDKLIVVPKDQDLNEPEEYYLGIVKAIQEHNSADFEKHFEKKCKSKPGKDSPAPFVNDDFLIFSFIVGVVQFNIDKNWINHIISIRNRNDITITFENILKENYASTSNLPEIVLMFLKFINQSLITNDLLNFTFRKINENTILFDDKSDFRILCAIRAYDLIIERKEATEGNEITLLKKFNQNFKKRIKILSWILQSALFFGLIFGLLKLPIYSPETIAFLDKYDFMFSVFGFLGFTIVGNQIPFVKNKSQELLMRLFGYPKQLIKN